MLVFMYYVFFAVLKVVMLQYFFDMKLCMINIGILKKNTEKEKSIILRPVICMMFLFLPWQCTEVYMI